MLFTQKKKQLILLILNIFLRQANIINSKRFIYCSVRNWEINDSNFFDFFMVCKGLGMQRSWYAKVLLCIKRHQFSSKASTRLVQMRTSAHRKGMQRSSFASSGTSFQLFLILLKRYNCLHLTLCSGKPLRGLCR